MKVQRKWLIVSAFWLYFLTTVFLYNRGAAWVNTFELYLEFAVTLALSLWYVVDRLQHRNAQGRRKGNWAVGPWGVYRRLHAAKGNPETLHRTSSNNSPPK